MTKHLERECWSIATEIFMMDSGSWINVTVMIKSVVAQFINAVLRMG